jgi:hypothetical protein
MEGAEKVINWEMLIEQTKERIKNRIPCKECNNKDSDAFKEPVRLTASCIFGERE